MKTKTVRRDNTAFAKTAATAKLKNTQSDMRRTILMDDRCFSIILAFVTVARRTCFSVSSNLTYSTLSSLQKLRELGVLHFMTF
jgi:hypothetical protein